MKPDSSLKLPPPEPRQPYTYSPPSNLLLARVMAKSEMEVLRIVAGAYFRKRGVQPVVVP